VVKHPTLTTPGGEALPTNPRVLSHALGQVRLQGWANQHQCWEERVRRSEETRTPGYECREEIERVFNGSETCYQQNHGGLLRKPEQIPKGCGILQPAQPRGKARGLRNQRNP